MCCWPETCTIKIRRPPRVGRFLAGNLVSKNRKIFARFETLAPSLNFDHQGFDELLYRLPFADLGSLHQPGSSEYFTLDVHGIGQSIGVKISPRGTITLSYP